MSQNAPVDYDTNNVFAKILRKEIPCKAIFEDEWALAFDDLYPKAPVHILVIPKGCYRDASHFHQQASSEAIAGFYQACEKVIASQDLEHTGYRLLSRCGKASGQEIFHFHVHILSP